MNARRSLRNVAEAIPAILVAIIFLIACYFWMTPAPARDAFPGVTAEQWRLAVVTPMEDGSSGTPGR